MVWGCEGWELVILKMATGTVPASFMELKSREHGLGFGKSMDFVKVSNLQRVKFGRSKVLVIRNSSSGSDVAELQAASEGSRLLGIKNLIYVIL